MRVGMVSREYPPDVYGGAGVHVEFLVRELRRKIGVDVHCFGDERMEPGVYNYQPDEMFETANPALQVFDVDLEIATKLGTVDLIHSHTWYANLAGVIAGKLNDVPHVVTAHSLEPLRPWKAEQLRGGYRLSCWAEEQAYQSAAAIIAVSEGMKADVLSAYPFVDPETVHVIHNGIDSTMYRPLPSYETLHRLGIDPERPIVLFVGRITRQKGLAHLLAAAAEFEPGVQLVLCAGAPDTPEIATETENAIAALRNEHHVDVKWIEDMLPREDIVPLLGHATVFVCPSIYEPLGIVNLEAMACGTAVVATDVGGIPEVVVDDETGTLVHYPADDADNPDAIAEFRHSIAAAVNALVHDPETAETFGKAGRKRATEDFAWGTIASKTIELYKSLL